MSENVQSIFAELLDNLELVINQIKGTDSSRPPEPDFSLDEFWRRIGGTVEAVSAASTKLCLAFNSPPTPNAKQCRPFVSGIETVTLALVSAYYSLPKAKGCTLHKMVQDSVVSIAMAVQALVRTIQVQGTQGSKSQLQSTGTVWEHCDLFPHLPKDNKAATLKVAKDVKSLVNDALQEIEEAQQGEGAFDDLNDLAGVESHTEDDKWSDSDRKIVAPASALVKATKSCLNKVIVAVKERGECDTPQGVGELDGLAERLGRVSPAVDNLVTGLYPPLDSTAGRENSEKLAQVLQSILNHARQSHFTCDTDTTWLDFLPKAIQHNLDKVTSLTQPPS